MEFGPLQGAHVGGMGLVQDDGEFAEYRARLGDGRDLQAVSDDLDGTVAQDEQLPGRRPGFQHGFTGLVNRYRKGSETLLESFWVRNKRHSHFLLSS